MADGSKDGFLIPPGTPKPGRPQYYYYPSKPTGPAAQGQWVAWDDAPPAWRAETEKAGVRNQAQYADPRTGTVPTGRDQPGGTTDPKYGPLAQGSYTAPRGATTDSRGMVPGLPDSYGGRNSAQQDLIDKGKEGLGKIGDLVPGLGGPTSGAAGAAAGGTNVLRDYVFPGLEVAGGILHDYQQGKAAQKSQEVSEEEKQYARRMAAEGIARVDAYTPSHPDLGYLVEDPGNPYYRRRVPPLSGGTNGNPPQTYGNPAGDQYSSGNPYEQRNTAAYPQGGAPTSMGTPIVPPLQFASPEEQLRAEEELRRQRGY